MVPPSSIGNCMVIIVTTIIPFGIHTIKDTDIAQLPLPCCGLHQHIIHRFSIMFMFTITISTPITVSSASSAAPFLTHITIITITIFFP